MKCIRCKNNNTYIKEKNEWSDMEHQEAEVFDVEEWALIKCKDCGEHWFSSNIY